MKLKCLFPVLAILGAILHLFPVSQFLLEHGLNIPLVLQDMMANEIASFSPGMSPSLVGPGVC